MSNINSRMGMLTVFIAASLFVGTLAIAAMGHDNAYATSKKIHVKSNDAGQAIAQPQRSSQGGQCISGILSLADCNNIGLQGDLNLGNNALGQR